MPIESIGSWTSTYLTKFLNDWLRRNPLPAQDQLTIKKLTVSGSAKVPTMPSSDSSTNAATTAFVKAATAALTTGVSSVFGRTGAVVAAIGDYTAAQVTNAADLSNTGTQEFLGGIQVGDATTVNAAARLTLGKAETQAAANLPWIQQHSGVGNDLALVSSSSVGTVSMWAGNGTTVGGGSNAMIASFGTDGAKIATTTTQKVGFYGATPVVQASAVGASTGYTAGTTTATFHSDDKYTGNVGTTAYTINGIVAALKNLGLIKS